MNISLIRTDAIRATSFEEKFDCLTISFDLDRLVSYCFGRSSNLKRIEHRSLLENKLVMNKHDEKRMNHIRIKLLSQKNSEPSKVAEPTLIIDSFLYLGGLESLKTLVILFST